MTSLGYRDIACVSVKINRQTRAGGQGGRGYGGRGRGSGGIGGAGVEGAGSGGGGERGAGSFYISLKGVRLCMLRINI